MNTSLYSPTIKQTAKVPNLLKARVEQTDEKPIVYANVYDKVSVKTTMYELSINNPYDKTSNLQSPCCLIYQYPISHHRFSSWIFAP